MLRESLSASTTLVPVSHDPTGSQAEHIPPVQQDLILLGAPNNVEHDVRLHLEYDHLLVIQYDVCCLLGGFLCGASDSARGIVFPNAPSSPFSNAF
jgi:hypothetical protein